MPPDSCCPPRHKNSRRHPRRPSIGQRANLSALDLLAGGRLGPTPWFRPCHKLPPRFVLKASRVVRQAPPPEKPLMISAVASTNALPECAVPHDLQANVVISPVLETDNPNSDNLKICANILVLIDVATAIRTESVNDRARHSVRGVARRQINVITHRRIVQTGNDAPLPGSQWKWQQSGSRNVK